MATHHTVLLISPGKLTSCQSCPWLWLHKSLPSLPGGPLPLVRNTMAGLSKRGITVRVYCQGVFNS